MKEKRSELVFIVDRSGSMGGLENDTIGGFNSMLNKQKQTEGDCRVTTVLFDNEYELIHDRLELPGVQPLTEKTYFVRGSTALLDAIGLTIDKIDKAQQNVEDSYKAENIVFVIITDGMENSSRRYSAETIRSRIKQKKEENNWEFLFLGANIDAVQTARDFGIDREFATDWVPDRQGVELNFQVMSDTISNFRETSHIPMSWNAAIKEDYKKRKKNK